MKQIMPISIEKYKKKLKKRKILYLSLFGLIIGYVVILVYLGAGDSRIVDSDAISFGSLCVFVLLGYLLIKIKNISLLLQQNDYNVLKSKKIREEDELKVWIYERSGGSTFLCSFIIALMCTITCSLFNNEAFLASLIITGCMLIIKTMFYLYNRHNYGGSDYMENIRKKQKKGENHEKDN